MSAPAFVFSAATVTTFNTTTWFLNLGGTVTNAVTVESAAQTAAPAAFTASMMGVNVTSNTVTGTPNFAIRIAGITGNETIALASAGTGWLVDSSHTDSIAAAALLDVTYTAASGGSVQIGALGFETVAASVGFAFYVCGSASWGGFMGSAAYYPLIGDPNATSSASVEANSSQKLRAAGTLSFLSITIIQISGTGHSATFRKNGSVGNQIVTGFSTLGVTTDSSHSDSIAAADICSTTTAATQTCQWNLITYMLAASGSPTQELAGTLGGSTLAASSTGYIPLAGKLILNTTESFSQFSAQTSAVASNLRLYVSATTLCSVAVTFRIGAADKNQAVSVPITTAAGWQEDVSHTDSIAAGNLYDTKFVTGVGSATGIGAYLVSLVTSVSTSINLTGAAETMAVAGVTGQGGGALSGAAMAGAAAGLSPSVSVTLAAASMSGAAAGVSAAGGPGLAGASMSAAAAPIAPRISINLLGVAMACAAAGVTQQAGANLGGVSFSGAAEPMLPSIGVPLAPAIFQPDAAPFFFGQLVPYPIYRLMSDTGVAIAAAIDNTPIAVIAQLEPAGPAPRSVEILLAGVSMACMASTITPSRDVSVRLASVAAFCAASPVIAA